MNNDRFKEYCYSICSDSTVIDEYVRLSHHWRQMILREHEVYMNMQRARNCDEDKQLQETLRHRITETQHDIDIVRSEMIKRKLMLI